MLRPFTFFVVLCAAIPALAQQDSSPLQRPSRPMREAAQTHYRSGSQFFESKQFDAALVEFEAAYRLSAEPDLLHNLSWTHEKAGHIKEALEYAARYASAVAGTDDEERARKRVEFLKQRYAGSATATATEPTAPSSGSAVTSPAPAPQPSEPQTAASATVEPQQTETKRAVSPLALGLVVGGGAVTAAGIGLLAGAWATGQQVGNADLAYADATALLDRGRALNTTGIALTIVGGAAVVGGAVTWVLGRRQPSSALTTVIPGSKSWPVTSSESPAVPAFSTAADLSNVGF